MTIQVGDDAYRVLERRVQEGQYDSLEEALDGSIYQADFLNRPSYDPEYLAYVHDRIEAGLADAEAGRLIPAEVVLSELRARLKK